MRRGRCDEIQGYFFSRPVAPRDMGVLVESGRCLPVDPDMPLQPAQTLLIVDDNPDVLWALGQLFEPDRYNLLMAGTAEEAFEQGTDFAEQAGAGKGQANATGLALYIFRADPGAGRPAHLPGRRRQTPHGSG